MKLDDAQKQQVAGWVEEGLKLSEIQSRISARFSVSLTYMEVRFLVDDLKLKLKDVEPPKAAAPALPEPAKATAPAPEPAIGQLPPAAPGPGAGTGRVSVTVDSLARAGAMISGSVTFSDGNSADWLLDQMGRLSLSPKVAGYRPPAGDVQAFQMELQSELQKMGF